MPRTIDPEIKRLLEDKDWLYEQHVTNLYGISEIARNLKITASVVRKAIRKHDIPTPSQQKLREASNFRKYGVKNPGQVKEFRTKATKTMVEKFGGHNWSHRSGKREQRDATCEGKYGNSNVGKTQYAAEKAKMTNLERYGREHVNQSHISKESFKKLSSIEWIWEQHRVHQRSLSDIAKECDVDMSILVNRLRKHNLETQHFFHSTSEKEILSIVRSFLPSTNIEHNTRAIISPYELDIYVPSHNLAIEYCGLYWHSDKFKENYYHRNKLHACQKQNIRLLTIFEDEWRDKREIVESKIKAILNLDDRPKVFARKTHIVNVTTKTKNDFLEKNHIQGPGPGSITYGLMYNGNLVAVMTFIKRSERKFELNRYATSERVVGGFSKLLKHFKDNHSWNEIVSFADLRWSTGNLYKTTGWTLEKTLRPDYYWCRNGQRWHKFNFRHKFLKERLEHYDATLSENENCKKNGFSKIYNCGLERYVFKWNG